MKNRSILCLGMSLVVAGLLPAGAWADTLVVHAKELQGGFSGYEDGKFVFVAAGKGLTREPRSSVQKLILEKPVDATLVQGNKSQGVRLLGYEQSRFIVEIDGARSEITGILVKSISVQGAPAAEGGSGDADGGTQPRRQLDLSGVDEATLTPGQAGALARYKAAWKRYSEFLARSSKMVAEMDKSRGAQREEKLDTLRERKNEEQPLLTELSAAEKVLRASFPGGAMPKANPAAPAAVPEAADGDPAIIDTTSIESARNLTAAQKDAIAQYKAAAARFTAATEPSGNAAAPDVVAAARQQLLKKQKALLAAFPGMTVR